MKAQRSKPVSRMSTSLRVSPSVNGYRFDTASRKKGVANIFESTDQESLQRLFKKSGDKKAEERAKIIFSIDQEAEEKSRALMALKQRTKDKLLQFLKLQKYSIKWSCKPSAGQEMLQTFQNSCQVYAKRRYCPSS